VLPALSYLLAAVVTGILLGVLAAHADELAYDPAFHRRAYALIAQMAFPWVLLAFAVGFVGPTLFSVAIVSPLSLVSGIVSYYAYLHYFGVREGIPGSHLQDIGEVWSLAAIGVGLAMGPAGYLVAQHRGWVRATALGAFSGSAAFEFVTFLNDGATGHDRTIALVAIAAAFALPVVLLRRPRDVALALGTTLLGGLVASFAYAWLRDYLWQIGG
jgi:hypothetical protein